jgi:YVTN family beta-propeller protein
VAFTPDGKTAFIANRVSNTLSTIDVKTRTKHPTDITIGTVLNEVAVTPDGKTAFVPHHDGTAVSTIDAAEVVGTSDWCGAGHHRCASPDADFSAQIAAP